MEGETEGEGKIETDRGRLEDEQGETKQQGDRDSKRK